MRQSIKKLNDLKSETKLIVKHNTDNKLDYYEVEIMAQCLYSFCMSMFRTSNSVANTLVFMCLKRYIVQCQMTHIEE